MRASQSKSDAYTSGPGTAVPSTTRPDLDRQDSQQQAVFRAASTSPGRIDVPRSGTAAPMMPRGGESSDPTQVIVPVMPPDELRARLLHLEQKHDMSSEEFYRRWQAGDLAGMRDAMRWAMLYELWRDRYLL